METLGVPITNTAILGALIKATKIIGMDAIKEVVQQRFGKLSSKNMDAMQQAYLETVMERQPISIIPKNEHSDLSCAHENGLMVEAFKPWNEVDIGCDAVHPGSSAEFMTGNWRTSGKPHTNFEKCTDCGICWIMCPDMAYTAAEDGHYTLVERYCKGCGICAEECPKGAIEMREE
jgi:pyruvate ferredoxin oxidoreductase delta subunit